MVAGKLGWQSKSDNVVKMYSIDYIFHEGFAE